MSRFTETLAAKSYSTSVYEGIAEVIETPIIRSAEPLVTEDVEEGWPDK